MGVAMRVVNWLEMRHLAWFVIPILLIVLGTVTAVAQDAIVTGAAPMIPTPQQGDSITSYIMTFLSAGGLGWLVRNGGIPLALTVRVTYEKEKEGEK